MAATLAELRYAAFDDHFQFAQATAEPCCSFDFDDSIILCGDGKLLFADWQEQVSIDRLRTEPQRPYVITVHTNGRTLSKVVPEKVDWILCPESTRSVEDNRGSTWIKERPGPMPSSFIWKKVLA